MKVLEKPNLSKFVCNIYDPRRQDSDEKYVNLEIQEPKRSIFLKYMRDLIEKHDIGPAWPTVTKDSNQLLEEGIIGLYSNSETAKTSIPSILECKIDIRDLNRPPEWEPELVKTRKKTTYKDWNPALFAKNINNMEP